MKITDVKTFKVNTGRQNWLFVKVICDNGLYGWGEASVEGQELAAEASIHLLAERSVIGEDPINVEKIWRQMYHHGFWKGGFIHMTAISGIDQAIWDILGKYFNVPTYQLLGGACRDKIRTYTHAGGKTPEEVAKNVTHCCFDLGFDGVKTGAPTEEALEMVLSTAREALGPNKKIMVDNHGQITVNEASRRLKIASKYDLFFYEEPVPPENPEEYVALRAKSYGVALAAGERTYNKWDTRLIAEKQLVDFYQPDICHCGGISEIRRMAAIAEVYHIKFAPHNPNGPVATAASIAVAASTQNFAILEFAARNVYGNSDCYEMDLKAYDGGYFKLPTTPGLGIELHEDAFKDHPYVDVQYNPRYAEDGSVLEI